MTTATPVSSTPREPRLLGQAIVVIGGSAGIGLETARQARGEGADVILTGRDRDRLQHAAADVHALSTAAFDATDPARLERFFEELPGPIDHVMVTAGGPYYARLADLDFTQVRRQVAEHLWLPLHVAPRSHRHGTTPRDAAVHRRHRRPTSRRPASSKVRVWLPCPALRVFMLPTLS
jgi:NAD(P)-dependent dehydrogenase (short-subunit alcohol dehydrogenase family)